MSLEYFSISQLYTTEYTHMELPNVHIVTGHIQKTNPTFDRCF
jgi:hypothetical protein